MRPARTCAVLFLCLVLPFSLVAQEVVLTASQPPTTITKDPQGIAVAAKAVAAMGGTQALLAYQDSLATGTITLYRGADSTSYPATLKCKGTHETRFELQRSDGTTFRIVNQGLGEIHRPDGSIIGLLVKNTYAERVNHIPLLSILAEAQNDNVAVQYQGTTAINGQTTDVLALTVVPNADPAQVASFTSTSGKLFFVDQTTGLVLKTKSTNYSENFPDDGVLEEVLYSDYRPVNGILVPFHQVTYSDGKLESDLVLNSAAFNVGLSNSDFAGSTAAEQVVANGTKATVRDVIENSSLSSAQKAAVKSALNRAGSTANVTVEKLGDGSLKVVTEAGRRAGGRIVYEKLVDPSGTTVSVIQKAYDAAGNLVHFDPKLP